MVFTWEGLKAFVEEQRKGEEIIKQREIARLEAEQEKSRTLEERTIIERKYWGSPQIAYSTWEERARLLVEKANEYLTRKKAEPEHARMTYGGKKFPLITERVTTKSGSCYPLTAKVKRKIIDRTHVSASEFWYKAENPDSEIRRFGQPITYLLTRNGVTHTINTHWSEPSSPDLWHYYEDPHIANVVLRNLLIPAILVERIEKWQSALVRCALQFHEIGKKLLSSPEYDFRCNYDDDAEIHFRHPQYLPDKSTVIKFRANGTIYQIAIFNPFNRAIEQVLVDLVFVTTYEPGPYGGHSLQGSCIS